MDRHAAFDAGHHQVLDADVGECDARRSDRLGGLRHIPNGIGVIRETCAAAVKGIGQTAWRVIGVNDD